MLAMSCSNEKFDDMPQGKDGIVSFKVDLPKDLKNKSRAFGDGTTATKLSYAVYDDKWNNITALNGSKDFIDGSLSTTVSFALSNGKTYNIVFWAANPEAPYTFSAADHTLTADYTNVFSNDEKLDAFVYVERGLRPTEAIAKTIFLSRPFAQVNFGSSNIDWADAQVLGMDVKKTGITVSQVYSKLNFENTEIVVTDVNDPSVLKNVTFGLADIPTGETFPVTPVSPVTSYTYLAMNYLFMPEAKETLGSITINYDEASTALSRTFTNLPVRQNYRTNIFCRLLTSDADYTVTIAPGFYTADNNVELTAMISTLEAGGTFKLTEDMNLNSVKIAVGTSANPVSSTLDLNGHNITADFSQNGTNADFFTVSKCSDLTITGSGTIDFIGYPVANRVSAMINNLGGTVTIESGNFVINNLNGSPLFWQMSDIVDNNSGPGNATLIVKGGTFTSFYNVFRNFANSNTRALHDNSLKKIP